MPVTATELMTLDSLKTDGPLRISDLADRESISQPGMTTLVNRLEARGYAERTADPTDGRAALVRITQAGLDVLDERTRVRAAVLADQVSRLAPEDQAALVAAITAIDRLVAAPSSETSTGKVGTTA